MYFDYSSGLQVFIHIKKICGFVTKGSIIGRPSLTKN